VLCGLREPGDHTAAEQHDGFAKLIAWKPWRPPEATRRAFNSSPLEGSFCDDVSYGRVGHSYLQGARKHQADHDDGAGQHADRDQWAFTVALHNKGPTAGLNGEPHRQRGNLLDHPDGHKEPRQTPANWRRVLTSLNLVVRGRNRACANNRRACATHKHCTSLDGAGSGCCVPFFAASWKQRQAAGVLLSSLS